MKNRRIIQRQKSFINILGIAIIDEKRQYLEMLFAGVEIRNF
jgi:hypothetical protein